MPSTANRPSSRVPPFLTGLTLTCVASGCSILVCTPEMPGAWPSFSAEVIRAGRASVVVTGDALQDQYQREFRERERQLATLPPPPEPTRENVLRTLKATYGGYEDTPAGIVEKRFEQWGEKAIDSLLAVLADAELRPEIRERAGWRLVRLSHRTPPSHPAHGRLPIELRQLSPDAGRIMEAVVAYTKEHPETDLHLGAVPYDRLPMLVRLIEDSQGERQGGYIETFCEMTHTAFPTIPTGFCGNSSAEEIRKAKEAGAKEQAKSVVAIREWWAEHGSEPYETWALTGLRRHLQEASRNRRSLLNDAEPRLHDFYVRECSSAYGFGPSVYSTMIEEFAKADAVMRPYILVMIANSRHPDAGQFVAYQLRDPDPNVQHAALEGIKSCDTASRFVQDIRTLLRPSTPPDIYQDALHLVVSGSSPGDVLQDLAAALHRPEAEIRQSGIDGLARRVAEHPEWLDRIRHVRSQSLAEIKERAEAIRLAAAVQPTTQPATQPFPVSPGAIEAARLALRSGDSRAVRSTISTIRRYELVELTPELLGLLPSTDEEVQLAAVEAIEELGVPAMTLQNLNKVIGHSLRIDRTLAMVAYSRFGRAARPLVEQVARRRDEPKRYGRGGMAAPSAELYRILVREHVPGIAAEIISLARQDASLQLLPLLDRATQIAVIREGLRKPERFDSLALVRSIRELKLDELRDELAGMSTWTSDPAAMQRALKEYQAGCLDYFQLNGVRLQDAQRPVVALWATLALLDFHDPRAWEPALQCLTNDRFGSFPGPYPAPYFALDMGIRLAGLDTPNRAKMLLEQELTQPSHKRIAAALTTALAVKPRPADADLLHRVASLPETDRLARILASVALARLEDRRAMPILQSLVREKLKAGRAPMDFNWMILDEVDPALPHRERLAIRPALLQTKLQPEQVDIAAALASLDDTSLVPEAVAGLLDDRRDFNSEAYRILTGLVGEKAYAIAYERVREVDPEQLPVLCGTAIWQGKGFPRSEAMNLLHQKNECPLPKRLQMIVRLRLTEASEYLVETYQQLSREWRMSEGRPILDALCALGDSRGVELASSDPLLFLTRLDYLPDAPVKDVPTSRFKYTRVENGLALQQWCEQNRQNLVWDRERHGFRLQPSAASTPPQN